VPQLTLTTSTREQYGASGPLTELWRADNWFKNDSCTIDAISSDPSNPEHFETLKRIVKK
jgi:hypothetical protein